MAPTGESSKFKTFRRSPSYYRWMPRSAKPRFDKREDLERAVHAECRRVLASFWEVPARELDECLEAARKRHAFAAKEVAQQVKARKEALRALADLRRVIEVLEIDEPSHWARRHDPEWAPTSSDVSGTPWEWWDWFIEGQWLPPAKKKLKERKLIVNYGQFIFLGTLPGVQECAAFRLLNGPLPPSQKKSLSVTDVLELESRYFRRLVRERAAKSSPPKAPWHTATSRTGVDLAADD